MVDAGAMAGTVPMQIDTGLLTGGPVVSRFQ